MATTTMEIPERLLAKFVARYGRRPLFSTIVIEAEAPQAVAKKKDK